MVSIDISALIYMYISLIVWLFAAIALSMVQSAITVLQQRGLIVDLLSCSMFIHHDGIMRKCCRNCSNLSRTRFDMAPFQTAPTHLACEVVLSDTQHLTLSCLLASSPGFHPSLRHIHHLLCLVVSSPVSHCVALAPLYLNCALHLFCMLTLQHTML